MVSVVTAGLLTAKSAFGEGSAEPQDHPPAPPR